MIKKKFTKEEDELLLKYSYSVALTKLSNRSKISIRSRINRLKDKGFKFENCKNPEANFATVSSYIIPGLDRTKLGRASNILTVLRVLDTSLEELKTNYRGSEIVFKRKMFCYFLREELKIDLQVIGNYINRDHSSVSYYYKDVTNKISIKDKEVTKTIEELNKIILT